MDPGIAPSYGESMRAALVALDDCQGLPPALIHPDFVLANAIGSRSAGLSSLTGPGLVVGRGSGPSPCLLLAEGAKDLRRIDRVLAGYRQYVDLEPDELSRLAPVARARPMILDAWSFCMGQKDIAVAAREVAEIADAVGGASTRCVRRPYPVAAGRPRAERSRLPSLVTVAWAWAITDFCAVQFPFVAAWMSATTDSTAMAIVRAGVASCPVKPACWIPLAKVLLAATSGARDA